MQIDGVFHLIRTSGWKIEDIYFFAVDRQQLEQPVSVANDYPGFLQQYGQVVTRPAKEMPASTSVKPWNKPQAVYAASRGIAAFLNSQTAKTIGGAV